MDAISLECDTNTTAANRIMTTVNLHSRLVWAVTVETQNIIKVILVYDNYHCNFIMNVIKFKLFSTLKLKGKPKIFHTINDMISLRSENMSRFEVYLV